MNRRLLMKLGDAERIVRCVSLIFFYGGFFGFFTTLFNTVSPVLPANGDADQIRSANYEPDLNSRIFFLFGPRHFSRSEHSVRK
jgi:hypothetical protein